MYDYIIVGSGLGGLSAGLKLALQNKKVLILEQNSLPGGVVATIKKGRFEFCTSLSSIYNYGDETNIGQMKRILDEYGIDPKINLIPLNTLVKYNDTKEEMIIEGDINDFFKLLDSLKPGSLDALNNFLNITREIHKALKRLEKGHDNLDEYPHFIKYLRANVIDALKDLKVPEETIHRLGYLWIYLESPLDKLSFIDFAEFIYGLAFLKEGVSRFKNIHLVLQMVNRYQELNGKIFYRSKVVKVDDKALYKIVRTSDNKEYKAKKVIFDTSKRYVCENKIIANNKDMNRLENARTLAPNGIFVYLGLNRDVKTLGFEHYHYYEFSTLNSIQNVKKMQSLFHNTYEAIVPNVINNFVSPKNTTIVILKTLYFGDVFTEVNATNYEEMKMRIANDLITKFERLLDINIKEYIEEMEIVTPKTIANIANHPMGNIMGYMRKSYDNVLNRIISYDDEELDNYYFVGESSLFGGGASNSIKSGHYVASKILNKESINHE